MPHCPVPPTFFFLDNNSNPPLSTPPIARTSFRAAIASVIITRKPGWALAFLGLAGALALGAFATAGAGASDMVMMRSCSGPVSNEAVGYQPGKLLRNLLLTRNEMPSGCEQLLYLQRLSGDPLFLPLNIAF
jgi:hypothetical protein